jgi:hypothetical protein
VSVRVISVSGSEVQDVRSPKSEHESGVGLVSRVSPVQTAVRNCTRDEGGPFEVGNHGVIPSHRKLLRSKAVVVSVAERVVVVTAKAGPHSLVTLPARPSRSILMCGIQVIWGI